MDKEGKTKTEHSEDGLDDTEFNWKRNVSKKEVIFVLTGVIILIFITSLISEVFGYDGPFSTYVVLTFMIINVLVVSTKQRK